jgi:hypothetical protein
MQIAGKCLRDMMDVMDVMDVMERATSVPHQGIGTTDRNHDQHFNQTAVIAVIFLTRRRHMSKYCRMQVNFLARRPIVMPGAHKKTPLHEKNGRLRSVFSHLCGNPAFRFACADLAAVAKVAVAEEAAGANEEPRFCVTRFRWFCPVPR